MQFHQSIQVYKQIALQKSVARNWRTENKQKAAKRSKGCFTHIKTWSETPLYIYVCFRVTCYNLVRRLKYTDLNRIYLDCTWTVKPFFPLLSSHLKLVDMIAQKLVLDDDFRFCWFFLSVWTDFVLFHWQKVNIASLMALPFHSIAFINENSATFSRYTGRVLRPNQKQRPICVTSDISSHVFSCGVIFVSIDL